MTEEKFSTGEFVKFWNEVNEGGIAQYLTSSGQWRDCTNRKHYPSIDSKTDNYRIKPNLVELWIVYNRNNCVISFNESKPTNSIAIDHKLVHFREIENEC